MSNIQEMLEQKLQADKASNELREYVIETILDKGDSEAMIGYMEDVLNHGCVSGIVSSLIYTADTHIFYDKYYDAIEDLRVEYNSEHGYNVLSNVGDSDLKNWLAWFAYEETLRKVADELGVYE